jgi:dihydrolipoamide dehydrogenase
MVEAKQVIVATGSSSRATCRASRSTTRSSATTSARSTFDAVPKKLGVIGAGVIGLEWAASGVASGRGHHPRSLPDFLVARRPGRGQGSAKVFTKQGLKTSSLGVKIGEVKISARRASAIAYEDKDGESRSSNADRLIVSVGRVPNTEGLNAEAVGLKLDERGQIEVDDHCRPTCPACGRWATWCAARCWRTRRMEEGVMVAELMAGQAGHCNFDTVPWVIYTSPEIAWVGKTEQQLKAAGVAYKVGKIPFMANGRALGHGRPTGFVKMLADAALPTASSACTSSAPTLPS